MATKGRPVTKTGPAAAKARQAAKKAYQSKTPAEKKAVVARQDKAARRRADEKRASQPQRIAYRKQDQKGVSGVPKGAKCALCGTTPNVQRHVVNGKFVRYLCGKHNVAQIGKGG